MSEDESTVRLQNSPYFCVFKYARKSHKWSGTRLKTESETGGGAKNTRKKYGKRTVGFLLWACEARASKTLTPHFADFFTDFEKKTDCFAV